MTYSTVMAHLDGARSNKAVLDVTAALAQRYDAAVIGIAACQPVQLGDCDGYMDGAFAVVERDIVNDELAHAKTEFHQHAGLSRHILEWRSIPTLKSVAHVVAEEARGADLLITSAPKVSDEAASHADRGDLILHAGRPVLIVPDANVATEFLTIVVAWNDTRECRRAIVDALPMLHKADRVIVAEVSDDAIVAGDGIRDVIAWLRRHNIQGDHVNARVKHSAQESLGLIAHDVEADLLVAGAYGHSRAREWAFGGVTRDLLLHERRCTLLSH